MYEIVAAAGEVDNALSDINPWIVGPVVFVFLTLVVIGLVMFGKGREHC